MRTVKIRKQIEQQVKVIASEQSIRNILKLVDEIVRAAMDEAELTMMKGQVRFLGEPFMLYNSLVFVVGMERHPVKRAASIAAIQKALKQYLGLDFVPDPAKFKRKRRKLLQHV